MKTERRHELKTNQLADSLARWIEAAKPYSRAGLALVVAAIAILFAWGYLSAQNSRRDADGWQEYFDAFNSRDPRDTLSDTSERYSGTPAGQWSRLVLADIQLDKGTNRLFIEKKDARDELRQAAEKYQSILMETRQPMMIERATFGLARAHEAMGMLDKARDEYRSIAKQWPDSPYAEVADKRAKDLDQQGTKEFYDWFAKYEPPRPLSKEPGTPGAKPNFLDESSLDDKGLKLPSVIDDKTPLPKVTGEPESAPPGDETKPADGQPPVEPAAEEPAAPADDKPAKSPSDKPIENSPPAAPDTVPSEPAPQPK
ncbi:MAG: hypothetical protein HY288_06030 [Planctomycetia bacterium]|nr:hypothetical protein [Planctomycetia bacterium]